MKKVFVLILLATLAVNTAEAGRIRVNVNLGIPVVPTCVTYTYVPEYTVYPTVVYQPVRYVTPPRVRYAPPRYRREVYYYPTYYYPAYPYCR